jgi:ubiquinone/menaquinone biosynthesis C-methylase UbiE
VENSHLTTYSILDVGTGSADVLHYFHNSFKINSEQFKLTGLDINPRHLNYAKSKLNHSKISLVQADAFKLPFADKSFDFVISSLFLHHFNPEQIKKMLPEFLRVSKNAIIMNDLIRDYVPLIFFKLTQLIFARSYLTRHDGTASVRRSYTVKEMKEVVSSLGIKNFEIKEYFPEYRMILMITPDA